MNRVLGLVTALLLTVVPVAAASDFEHPASSDTSQQFTTDGNPQREDTPNDPDYDQAEDPDPTTTSLYDERFDLFGFPSKHTPLAIYKDGVDEAGLPKAGRKMVAGFNAAGAWKAERGDPDVFVAILDRGVTLRGTSRDRGCGAKVRRLYVALQRALGDGRCRSLLRSRRFRSARSCHRTVYISAIGTRRWRIRLKVHLRPGRYKAWVRGVDAGGNVERKAARRNLIRFRVK